MDHRGHGSKDIDGSSGQGQGRPETSCPLDITMTRMEARCLVRFIGAIKLFVAQREILLRTKMDGQGSSAVQAGV